MSFEILSSDFKELAKVYEKEISVVRDVFYDRSKTHDCGILNCNVDLIFGDIIKKYGRLNDLLKRRGLARAIDSFTGRIICDLDKDFYKKYVEKYEECMKDQEVCFDLKKYIERIRESSLDLANFCILLQVYLDFISRVERRGIDDKSMGGLFLVE